MKNKLYLGIILGFIFCTILAVIFSDQRFNQVEAATITRGITFGTTDLVTNTKLHQLVDNATISAIGTSDLSDGGVTLIKLAANSVDTTKIVDGTIVTADVANRTLLDVNIATNTITSTVLSTNQYLNAGIWSFTNVVIATDSIASTGVSGVTTSAGAGDTGKLPKLNSSGKLDNSFLTFPSIVSSNRVSAVSGTANTWQQIASVITTITNGTVVVSGRALGPQNSTATLRMRVRDSGQTVSAGQSVVGISAADATALNATLIDSLTTTTKTYVLEISDGTGTQTWLGNSATGINGDSETNHLGISIMQYGK